MERQEKRFLEAIKRGLERDLERINQLVKRASPPKGRRGETPLHVQQILEAIRKRGGKVTKQQLSDIVSSAGMIVTAVGTLYQAGYLKQDLKDKGYVVLGPRAQTRKGSKRLRRTQIE